MNVVAPPLEKQGASRLDKKDERLLGREKPMVASWWQCSPIAATKKRHHNHFRPKDRRRSLPTVSDLSSSHPDSSSSQSDYNRDSQASSYPSENTEDENEDDDEEEDSEAYGDLSVDTTFWSLASLSGPLLTTATSTSTAPTAASSSQEAKKNGMPQSRCWAPTFSSSASSVDSMELFPPHDDQSTVAWTNVGDDPVEQQPEGDAPQQSAEQVEVDWEVWHIHAFYDSNKVPLFRVESTRTEAGGVTATLRAEEIGSFIRSLRSPEAAEPSCTASCSSSVLRDVELVMTQDPETCHNELVRFIRALVQDQEGQLLMKENAQENPHLWARLKSKLTKKKESKRRTKNRPHPFSSLVASAALAIADSDTQAALAEDETNAPVSEGKGDLNKGPSSMSPRALFSRAYLSRRSHKTPSLDAKSTFLEELKQHSARQLHEPSMPEHTLPSTPTRTASSSSDGSLRTVRQGNQRSSDRVEITWTPPLSPPADDTLPNQTENQESGERAVRAIQDNAVGWSVQAFYNDVGNLIFHMSNGSVVLTLS